MLLKVFWEKEKLLLKFFALYLQRAKYFFFHISILNISINTEITSVIY